MTIREQITQRFPVRRKPEQKDAFRRWMVEECSKLGYSAQVEENQKHCNVVIGDPETARAIFTAHYDTPAGSFLPNFMTPRSRAFFWVRQVGMILLFALLGSVLGVPVWLLTGNGRAGFLVGWLVYMAGFVLMMKGPANRNNVNDNTSGVAAVMELMARIPEEQRSKVAFILFDDEEKGLLGSKAYAKAHPAVKESGFVVNLDCVGDGGHVLLLAGKKAREAAPYAALTAGMEAQSGRELHIFPLEKSVYNSDQKNFKVSCAICACRVGKHIGFYCDKIHTSRDTVCEQVNLDFIAGGLSEFVTKL